MKYSAATLLIVCGLSLVVGMWLGRITTVPMNTYDMPEEFNPLTISHDLDHPTPMDVVYNDSARTYLFMFKP